MNYGLHNLEVILEHDLRSPVLKHDLRIIQSGSHFAVKILTYGLHNPEVT